MKRRLGVSSLHLQVVLDLHKSLSDYLMYNNDHRVISYFFMFPITFWSRLLSAGFKAVSSPLPLLCASPPSGLDPGAGAAASPEPPLSALFFSFCGIRVNWLMIIQSLITGSRSTFVFSSTRNILVQESLKQARIYHPPCSILSLSIFSAAAAGSHDDASLAIFLTMSQF